MRNGQTAAISTGHEVWHLIGMNSTPDLYLKAADLGKIPFSFYFLIFKMETRMLNDTILQ